MAGKFLNATLLLGLLLIFLAATCHADGLPDFSKMRVKELRKILDERGVECVGCVEKEHLVSRVKETYDLPLLTEEELKELADKKKPQGAGKGSEKFEKRTFQDFDTMKNKKYDDADMQKIMDELKKSGAGGFKMYTPDDLKNYDLGEFADKEKDEL